MAGQESAQTDSTVDMEYYTLHVTSYKLRVENLRDEYLWLFSAMEYNFQTWSIMHTIINVIYSCYQLLNNMFTLGATL